MTKIYVHLIDICFHNERLLLTDKMPGFLASGGDEFNSGPETRLDH